MLRQFRPGYLSLCHVSILVQVDHIRPGEVTLGLLRNVKPG